MPPGAVRQAKRDIAEAERDLAEHDKVITLREAFSFHDLRHYLASLLISSGPDLAQFSVHAGAESAQVVVPHVGATIICPAACARQSRGRQSRHVNHVARQ